MKVWDYPRKRGVSSNENKETTEYLKLSPQSLDGFIKRVEYGPSGVEHHCKELSQGDIIQDNCYLGHHLEIIWKP